MADDPADGSGGDADADPATVARLGARAPGADPEDPYAGVDLDALPDWWRRAAEEFAAHGLRPYRPPRFADGTPTHEVVGDLEAELGVDIAFGAAGGEYRDAWTVRVDGEPAASVGRHRSPEGYTVYEVPPDAFVELVREAVTGGE